MLIFFVLIKERKKLYVVAEEIKLLFINYFLLKKMIYVNIYKILNIRLTNIHVDT